jgi:tRNA(Ile)-lysidine synthase
VTDTGWPQSEGEDAFLLHVPAFSYPGEWPGSIAVAVSGGSDSMALLHLFTRLQRHHGGTVHAVTIDHRLRPEAAEEARFVARFCAELGVPHEILVWVHGAIEGNVQDKARRARYALIGDWAHGAGIGDVVLGHTADDQAETFLMGLAREAGLDGLSGMRRNWTEDGIRWARPYLATPREDLRAYLVRHGIDWIEDPSNSDDRYQRVKARRAMRALAPLGITTEGLAGVATNLALARSDLVHLAVEAAQRIARTSAGEVVFDLSLWKRTGPDTRRRLLIAALRWVSSAEYAPRSHQIARLEASIRQGRDATLSGCRVRVSEDEFYVSREPKAVAGLECRTDALWDHRWRLTGPHDPALRIRALGAAGLSACKDWRETGLSRAALIVSPAIWRGDDLIAAPLAGKANGWRAEIVTAFPQGVLSH